MTAPLQSAEITQDYVEFRGDAKEWFGIWIVNLLLSLLTLGIYSAWAKVRSMKYFYNNCVIAGRSFDYHATGKQILIGRAIVVGAFLLYAIVGALNPILAGVMLLAFAIAFPYLMLRATMFNARMSSWSNIRFNFEGSYFRTLVYYFIFPALSALTLYLALPLANKARQSYVMSGHRFGTARFKYEGSAGAYYKGSFLAILWGLGIGLLITSVFSGSAAFVAPFGDLLTSEPQAEDILGLGLYLDTNFVLFMLMFLAANVVLFVPAAAIYWTFVRNDVFNSMTLEGGHKFASWINPWAYLWIAASNAFVVLITLGLMTPWAQIRRARYLASHTAVIPAGSLDEFLDQEHQKLSSLGDAATDFEGVDIGLPI